MINAKNKRELAATLFPIDGLSDTTYEFRILKVRERIPEDNRQPIRLQNWADRLWRRDLRCPVFPTNRFGYPAFIVPENDSLPVGESIEIHDVPDLTYHIDITEETMDINIEEAIDSERELICKMLERQFTDKLRSMKEIFWKDQWTLFYFQKPVNSSVDSDIVNAYRGYKFGVVFVEGRGPHLAVDVRTRYVGRKSLSKCSIDDRRANLLRHLDLDLRYKDRARFLRDNGTVKFPCKYTGPTEEMVCQRTIDDSGKTVLDYYQENYPELNVESDDPVVFTKDREDKQDLPVPSSRLFPIFTTEYEGVSKCTVQPQMTPDERFSEIQGFLEYLRGIRYGDTPLTVSDEILIDERTVYIPPNLEFGNGHILQPFQNGSVPIWSESFDSNIVRWNSKKLPALYEHGPCHNEHLPGIVLLYPQSIRRQIREKFLEELRREIKLQTGQDILILQQQPYQIGKDERMGGSLRMLATKIQSTVSRCLAVVILWNKFHKDIHGILKETFRGTPSQFVWERTILNICNQYNPQRGNSRLRNLALGVITEAGVKPWVLAEPLHHDLHIGIDLLYGQIGYHFLYGTGGRIIETDFGKAIERGRFHEAIKKPELRYRLVKSIKSIVEQGHDIQSIVIHRDGRWWKSEHAGLEEALRRLKSDGTLPHDVCCGVVEVRKNHMPIRLFTSIRGTEPFFRNPLPGTYFVLDSNRVLLTTTGRPGAWDEPGGRTASTLLLEVVDVIGDIDIEKVAEDAYRLTQLNWNAPNIDISLPVTIRWTDDALRETFYVQSQEEEDREEPRDYESDEGDKVY